MSQSPQDVQASDVRAFIRDKLAQGFTVEQIVAAGMANEALSDFVYRAWLEAYIIKNWDDIVAWDPEDNAKLTEFLDARSAMKSPYLDQAAASTPRVVQAAIQTLKDHLPARIEPVLRDEYAARASQHLNDTQLDD
jgi:hypothetical protein